MGGGGYDVEGSAGGEEGEGEVGVVAGGHDEDGVVVGEVANAGSEGAVEGRFLG